MRLARLLPLVPVLTLGVAACGGGSDDGATKDDFVSKANAICKDLNAEGDDLDKLKPKTPAELVTFANRAQKFVNDDLDRFKALELPKDGGDREGAQEYVAQLEKAGTAVDELETQAGELQKAVEARDRSKVQSVGADLQQTAQDVKEAGDKSDDLARDYGLEECSKKD